MDEGPMAKLIERKITAPKIDVAYPEIKGLKDSLFVQVRTNEMIRSVVYNAIHDLIKDKTVQPEIKGLYRVTCNRNGILSILFRHEETDDKKACNYLARSITISLKNARVYEFEDLFEDCEALQDKLNSLILDKIKNGNVTLKRCFRGLDREQEFYCSENTLVIYFQPGRYTTPEKGIFELAIPLSELEELLAEECPLAKFAVSQKIQTTDKKRSINNTDGNTDVNSTGSDNEKAPQDTSENISHMVTDENNETGLGNIKEDSTGDETTDIATTMENTGLED